QLDGQTAGPVSVRSSRSVGGGGEAMDTGTLGRTRWDSAFAERTRGDVGEGLAAILALANVTDIISFSGGFPDPSTFPAAIVAGLVAELASAGDASALQYAPTEGLPGLRAYLTDRLERLGGRRPESAGLLGTAGGRGGLRL